MTKTERVIVVTGAGLIVLAWLFGRCRTCRSLLAAFGSSDESRGLPPRTITAQPINNALSTCDCPAAKTTVKMPGDYSQGSYVRDAGIAVAPINRVAGVVPRSFSG